MSAAGCRVALLIASVTSLSACGLQKTPMQDPTFEDGGASTVPPEAITGEGPLLPPIITPHTPDGGLTNHCGDGVLDKGELCDPGLQACCSDTCDGVRKKNTECRSVAGACDAPEQCDGIGPDCPADATADRGTACRPAAGDCDVGEVCDGTHKQCPVDTFMGATTLCRMSAGDCDVPESCTGSSAACPDDAVAPVDTQCRAAVGLCDAPEACDGTRKDCPADAVLAQDVVCGLPIDLCDAAEVCDGSGKDCPPTSNALEPAGTICRRATAQCRLDARCGGSSMTCPSNGPAPNGTACNDGLANTVNDECTGGACAGADRCVGVTCTASDQCHVAGTCDHATGSCSNPSAQNGVACNDGNANTINDACAGGACVGVDLCINGSCTASDQCHVAGTCNPNTGICANPNRQDGSACDDTNANTVNDVCTGGVCAGTDLCANVTCAALDQCHLVGACSHANGVCSNPNRTDGASCDDANANTVSDVCNGGLCAGTDLCASVTCTALDQCHVAGACNHANGTCSNPNKSNGSSCDDGNANTIGDVCTGGVCAGTDLCANVTCTALDQCHVPGVCNHANGVCTNPNKGNGSSCNDGNANTINDACTGGVCAGTDLCANVTCTALDQCHVPGACNHANGVCDNPNKSNGAACNDGNANTVNDACTNGTCAGINLCVSGGCPVPDQCHLAGTCNPASGICSYPNKSNGAVCNDNNANTVNDVCTGGVCGGTNLCANVTCTALDQCHVPGACIYATGVCDNPNRSNGAACNDNNANTINDACTNGVCAGIDLCASVTCPVPDQCHDVGTCNHQTGVCSNPPKSNNTACNDGNACTQTDQCQSGSCVGTTPVTCTASDQCHDAGTCNTQTGACSNPAKSNNTTCNDGNACTQTDQCQSGNCVGSTPVTCTALDQCHIAGTCNTQTGACSNPAKSNTATCNDGNPCTQTDQCTNGTCGGSAIVCSALDQCHVAGTCSGGVCSNPTASDGTSCNDSNACTQTDKCSAGNCSGTNPIACPVPDQCHTAGSCDTQTGLCSNPAKGNGASCDDANACTRTDQCQSGSCVGSNPVICSALDRCHFVGVCNPADGSCPNPVIQDGQPCNFSAGDPGPGHCWNNGAVCCPGVTMYSAANAGCALPQGDKIVFVSSSDQNGAVNGLLQADKICKDLAAGAKLASTYTAWLSTAGTLAPGVNAKDRIGSGPYVRVDGALIANDKADLTDGSLSKPIDQTEWGVSRSVPVWTDTGSAGTVSSANDCGGWTSNSANGDIGSSSATTSAWTDVAGPAPESCDKRYALYCFQDDCPGVPSVERDPANCGACGNVCQPWQSCVQGRCGGYVFVTSQQVFGNFGGPAAADDMCNQLAKRYLPGTYAAWLSTSAEPAYKRIGDFAYFRPDKALVAIDKSHLLSASATSPLLKPINLQEDGAAITQQRAWTGSDGAGNDTGNDCQGWMSQGGSGTTGSVEAVDEQWTKAADGACGDSSSHLYCFQIGP